MVVTPRGSTVTRRFRSTRAIHTVPSARTPQRSVPESARFSKRREFCRRISVTSTGASRATVSKPVTVRGARTIAAESRLPLPSRPATGGTSK